VTDDRQTDHATKESLVLQEQFCKMKMDHTYGETCNKITSELKLNRSGLRGQTEMNAQK